MVSEKTIGRLVVYRRLLNELHAQGVAWVHSHRMAELASVTATQVRRDLMVLGHQGTPIHGYEVTGLLDGLRDFMDTPQAQNAALVGIGHLGQAILAYFAGRRPKLAIRAAFDKAPARIHCTLHGCECHPVEALPDVIRQLKIKLAILAVPAEAAQETALQLIEAGVRGLVNFAPVPLQVPEGVFVENMDITSALEKVAFFALRGARLTGGARPVKRTQRKMRTA